MKRAFFFLFIFRGVSPWSFGSTVTRFLHGEAKDYVWEEKSGLGHDILEAERE